MTIQTATWQSTFQPLEHNQHDALPPLMISYLSDWGAITVEGEDKKSYLQGQLTCDVISLDQNESTLGAHCDAKGKMWGLFRLFHHHKQNYTLFLPNSAQEKSLAELKKYSIFSKVSINYSTDIAFAVMGERAEKLIEQLTDVTGNVRPLTELSGTAVKVEDHRWLLLIEPSQVETLLFHADLASAQRVAQSLWDRFDVESAIPRITIANQNQLIPQMLNLQALNAISFNKGCYTGQETVARAKYRGANKRAMFLVQGNNQPQLKQGESLILERSVGEHWREAGEVNLYYQFKDRTIIALIVLPNDAIFSAAPHSEKQLVTENSTDINEMVTYLRNPQQPNEMWQIKKLPYVLD